MTNSRIKTLLRESNKENEQYHKNHKICLCEDIIKAKRTLWAFGEKQHNEFIQEHTATQLFDNLYDLDITALELLNNNYGKQINKILTLKLQAV